MKNTNFEPINSALLLETPYYRVEEDNYSNADDAGGTDWNAIAAAGAKGLSGIMGNKSQLTELDSMIKSSCSKPVVPQYFGNKKKWDKYHSCAADVTNKYLASKTPAPQTQTPQKPKGMSTGLIIGLVGGGLLLLATIVIVVVKVSKPKKA